VPLQRLQGCYNINVDEDDDPEDDDPRDVNMAETEVTEQVNKLANVGDYWDDATISKIIELFHEYRDLFPTNFTDMKGIKGPIGEMKIPLKPDARPVKKRPYRLNPKYK
jgi:hypothetical protein